MTEPADNAAHSLITRERTGKLELLIHLLANLNQHLVLCGPEGIGKTTLLNAVQAHKADLWQYCCVKGHTDLSFENVLMQLGQVGATYGKNLNDKLVLIIDDAGALVPGLITAIIQYAEASPSIRVVFALTHDELFVVSRADRIIEDCHVIEIPPLLEQQCGEFLQYLAATSPGKEIAFASITDSFIRHVYQETRGIPGKIVSSLSLFSAEKKQSSFKWLLILALLAAFVLLGVQKFEQNSIDKWLVSVKSLFDFVENKSPPQEHVLPSPPAPEITALDTPPELNQDNNNVAPVEPIFVSEGFSGSDSAVQLEGNPIPADDLFLDNIVQEPDNADDEAIEQTPVVTLQPEQSSSLDTSKVNDETNDDNWLSAQPAHNFTLQLMVLTRPELVSSLRKKHQSLRQKIKIVKRVKQGKARFVVLLGSFASAELAKGQLETLPKDFSQAVPRKIDSIIKELK